MPLLALVPQVRVAWPMFARLVLLQMRVVWLLVLVPQVRVARAMSARLVLLQVGAVRLPVLVPQVRVVRLVTALPVEVTRVMLALTTARVLETARMMPIRAMAVPTVVPPRVLPSRVERPAQAKSPAWVCYAGP